ncbi:MAG: DUF4175 family protein [Myxococcota bacterium]
MNPPPELKPILEELDETARRAAWTDAALWALAGVSVAFTLAIAWAHWGAVAAAAVSIGLLVPASLIAAWWFGRREIDRETRVRSGAARLAEELLPELGSAARTAVDLQNRLDRSDRDQDTEAPLDFSRTLAEDHVLRTARRLERVDLAERYLRSRRPRRQKSIAALAVLGAIAIALWFSLESGRSRLVAFFRDPTAARVSDVPLTGDITITYRFPAYTGLPPRVVPGGDGSISAVTGTQVQLEAIADREVRRAVLKVLRDDETDVLEVPLTVEDGRRLQGELSILHNGTYFFELETPSGDRLEDRVRHSIAAELDEYPVVGLDEPREDVELKDNREIDVVWGARDDFGVGEVALVVELPGVSEPQRVVLDPNEQPAKRREGRYRWSVAELDLKPGQEARFYVEAVDNDTIGGPKKASSEIRKLVIFSARERHRELVNTQRQMMDKMVDLLARELENPFVSKTNALAESLTTQKGITGAYQSLSEAMGALVLALEEDQLSEPAISEAFVNIAEHLTGAEKERRRAIQRVEVQPENRNRRERLAATQTGAVTQLEKDLIYLDDLIAIQKIDELKETASDLLDAQRELQKKLERFRETKDPGLRAELEREIRALRQKMMEMLARMSDIKRQLPGEYRNMESGRMLEMDSQLDRLEKMLREGNLDEAAAELEQLANMIEDMVDNINESEQQFGDERYSEMRQKLQEFSQEYQKLQAEQEAITERAEAMELEYRKRSIEQAGRDLDDVIRKARRLAGEAQSDLENAQKQAPFLFGQLGDQLERGRQRLADLDSLLKQKDLAEARDFGGMAEDHLMWAEGYLRNRAQAAQDARAERSWQSGQEALNKTREINALLDRLFPDPREVMSEAEQQRMERMARKQQQLEQQANELSEQMAQMSQEMPVFGQEPRDAMARAQSEMGKASQQMRDGQLPGAAASKRRALDELEQLQQSLEQAAQQGGGQGMPMPLAGGKSRRRGQGAGDGVNRDPVELPGTDKNRANPSFRQELLEAAKQKAPDRYEDATRRYYEELIR